MPRRRFLIIHNPRAGPARQRLLAATINALSDAGSLVTTQIAPDLASGRQLAQGAAASGEYDAVIAAGGDSTIRGVAAGLLDAPVPLGIIPVGTGNVMAEEIGLGRKAGEIARTLVSGPIRELHAALANGAPFFLMAGIGFDADIVASLSEPWKRRVGKAAYVGPTLVALARPLPELRVEIDGSTHSARWIVIGNARCYGGAFVLSPDLSIFRPGLIAVLFQPATRLGLIRQLVALATGRIGDAGGVRLLPCAAARVEAGTGTAWQIDGEIAGETPLEIRADGRTVSLICPGPGAGSGATPSDRA